MMKLLYSLLGLGLLMLASCAPRQNASEAPSATNVWSEALAKYRNNDSVRHVVMVQCTGGSDARVLVYEKDDDYPAWKLMCESDGFIGRNGYTADKHEGDGMSPVGDFGILSAFGILEQPDSCAFPYVHVNEYTYAIDSDNEFYNKIIDTGDGGPREGEHMIDYSPEYNYGLALDYNKECVYGRGSNIFFHCKGVNEYTGGCVAVDETLMKTIICTFSPADRVIIVPK